MVLNTALLNTQQYKVHIKGKVEQSRERSSVLLYTFGVVAIEKGAFWSPSTTVANFTSFIWYLVFLIQKIIWLQVIIFIQYHSFVYIYLYGFK